MGTITPRKRANGSTGYTAQIRIKKAGKLVHQEAQTFDRRQAAAAWLKKREGVLAEPGAIERSKMPDPMLRDVIDRYLAESEKAIGRTKSQVLRTIKDSDVGTTPCSRLGSEAIVSYARSLTSSPQTRGNYLSHLASIFAVARPAWGYALDQQAMRDAQVVLRRLGLIAKSRSRDRRPTLAELDMILAHYVERRTKRPVMTPMAAIVVFALFSTRRLDEITRITWADLDETGARVLVRDMKNPGEKIGNDVWCDLPPEALRIVRAQPRTGDRIFPFNGATVSTSFTNTTSFLAIDDLHFHDLRHDGISRLFELGATIPKAAGVSGHRSWNSLKRYTHLRHSGDKYQGWAWIERVSSCDTTALVGAVAESTRMTDIEWQSAAARPRTKQT